jgi:hypothetical protein
MALGKKPKIKDGFGKPPPAAMNLVDIFLFMPYLQRSSKTKNGKIGPFN